MEIYRYKTEEATMKLGGIGIPELLIILAVILLIFGPKNLPKLGSALGKTVKNLREGMESAPDIETEEESEPEPEPEPEPKPKKKRRKKPQIEGALTDAFGAPVSLSGGLHRFRTFASFTPGSPGGLPCGTIRCPDGARGRLAL